MRHLRINSSILKLLLIGGLFFGVIMLTRDDHHAGFLASSLAGSLDKTNDSTARVQPSDCQGEIADGVVISREQLASFLTVSERDARSRVEDILQKPYCRLANLEVRAGVAAERVVYPLAFDPQTWLVVLYEGNEYAGYQFRIQR